MKVWINKTAEETPNSDFEDAIRFDMLDEGPKSNLKVNFEEIWRRFNREKLEDIYEDLITVAASVYAADKRVPRVGVWVGEVEDNWTREIHISIPVLELKKWSEVKTKLEDILNFLSGDIWTVNFRKTNLKFRNYVTKKKYDIIEGSHPMRADKGIKGRPRNCGYCYPCLIRRASLNGIDISEEYLEDFKEDYKIGMTFVRNEKFSNPDTGKTTDLKAVLLAVHNYLKYGSKEYYTEKLISLGGMDMQEIEKFVDVYMKSMGELYNFIKEQARFNGNELLQFIEGEIDE